MSFFSVSSRKSAAQFAIEDCHINFWVIPTHWYQKFQFGFSYFFDVGLRLKPAEELTSIRVTFPFDSRSGNLQDLSEYVTNSQHAPLIFGRPVIVHGDFIDYDGASLGLGPVHDRVVPIDPRNSKVEEENDSSFSVWSIKFEGTIKGGETAYLRFRIVVENPNSIWASKGWGFAKRGVIANFKVCDIRESVLLGQGAAEADHIVPISRLFLFVGAPSYFVPNHFSPILRYSRLLEATVWDKYLGFSARRKARISIHQWRGGGNGSSISVSSPFRAYMDLSREFGGPIWIYYVVGVVGASLIFKVIDWIISRVS